MIDFDWKNISDWSKETVEYTYLEKMVGSIMCTAYASMDAERYYLDCWD